MDKTGDLRCPPAVTTGNVEALSLSVMLSTRTRCNANCKACISRNTGGKTEGEVVEHTNFQRLKSHILRLKAMRGSHVILTEGADPLQERGIYLGRVVSLARECDIPYVDMHTNGLRLQSERGKSTLQDLADMGLTHITFSVASFNNEVNREFMGVEQRPFDLIQVARQCGLRVRCSLLLTKETVHDLAGILDYVQGAKAAGVRFVVIREVWAPSIQRLGKVRDSKTLDWCVDNQVDIDPLIEETAEYAHRADTRATELDSLPWGQRVFDIYGVNVTYARCDDGQKGQTLKSIVAKPDGELYRGWDNDADVLY